MCEHDCQPFLSKNSVLASIQKTLYWKQTPLSIFLCVQDKKIETSHFSFFPLEYPQQKRKSLSRACHHWWCFALLIGLFVCCIFSQEEKDYSSSSSKWLFLNTSRNSSISSFEFGFIIFTT